MRNQNNNNKGIKHKIMMALCIGAPIVGMLLLFLSRAGIITLGGAFLPYILFLLCPLSHFLMMPLMMKAMHGKETVNAGDNEQKQISCH